jgi:Tfp pilus assembly protein PilV
MPENKIINRKIKASSILEVVVALVLAMIVFGISMMLFANVVRSGVSLQQLHGTLLLNDLYIRTRENKSFYDEEIKEGDNIIHKKVSKFKNMPQLVLLELEIVNPEDKKLSSRKDIILIETDE